MSTELQPPCGGRIPGRIPGAEEDVRIARLVESILQLVERAPSGPMIALVGLEVVELLLRKNCDYGNSAHEPPMLVPNMSPVEGMLCRMSDKVKRMIALAKQGAHLTNGCGKVGESYQDTVKDQAGYLILLLSYYRIVEGEVLPPRVAATTGEMVLQTPIKPQDPKA